MTSTAAPAPSQPAPSGAGEVPGWLPLAAVGTTLLLWASAFVAIRHLGQDFSAGPLSLGRLLVGAAVLGVVALSRGVPHPTRREWVSLVSIGVLWFGIYNVALNEGEQRVDAGTAAMLIQLSPVLIAVLAAVFLDERFTAYLGLGLALAFGGVALISVSTSESAGHDVLGVFLCLLSAVVYSISLILQKPLVARLQAVHVTWLACTVGMVLPVQNISVTLSWPQGGWGYERLRNEVLCLPGTLDVTVFEDERQAYLRVSKGFDLAQLPAELYRRD